MKQKTLDSKVTDVSKYLIFSNPLGIATAVLIIAIFNLTLPVTDIALLSGGFTAVYNLLLVIFNHKYNLF
jgi:hypothetical protein